MSLDKIFTSVPVNRSAALVTSGTHYEETEREKLVQEVKNLDAFLIRSKQLRSLTKEQYKEYGKKKHELQAKINALKDKKKILDPKKTPIEFYFMEVCRENMHKLEFTKLLKMAMDKRGY